MKADAYHSLLLQYFSSGFAISQYKRISFLDTMKMSLTTIADKNNTNINASHGRW